MNSNWTLRFPRTGREAFGHEVRFERRRSPEWLVGACVAMLYAFVAGLVVGGAIPW